ncbi:hypothetical protein VTL71DRAFT_7513 [Oculimacula yallundae]|uniref:Heterokaryon incompatibility domain-containing protein n=1 Tax=Oculimacula yallundae TaxID=86028 RepID=A0ABR4BUB7_9HELO
MEEKTPFFEIAGRMEEDRAAATLPAAKGTKRKRSSTTELEIKSRNGRIPDCSFQNSIKRTNLVPATIQQCSTVYSPLNPEGDEIRLVRLFPGHGTQPIECELIPVKTEGISNHPYEALSYTWGSSTKADRIILDGADFEVTANLWSALSHLRLKHSVRNLWIDAISINQANVHERNSQVKKMGMIYRLAKIVIVWLGEEGDNSSAAFDFLRQVTVTAETNRSVADHLAVSPRSAIAWPALIKLSYREYWHRVWIIQEILCSTEAVLCCGNDSIPLSKFTELRQICSSSKMSETVASYYTELEATPAFQLDLQRMFMGSGRSLLQLLEASKSSHSTEHKDRIFALLGLANDDFLLDSAEDRLVVDYDMSVPELYHHTVRLHAVEDRVHVCELLQCILDPLERKISASGRDFGHSRIELPLVEATGYSVGTIETVMAVPPSLISGPDRSSFLSLLRKSKLLDGLVNTSCEPQAELLLFWMDQFRDSDHAKLLTVVARMPTSPDSVFSGMGLDDMPERVREDSRFTFKIGERQHTILEDFKLFITSDGIVGFGPNSIQPGDVAYMFCRSTIVLVLSPKQPRPDSCAIRRCFAFLLGEEANSTWMRSHRMLSQSLTAWLPKSLSGETMTFEDAMYGQSASSSSAASNPKGKRGVLLVELGRHDSGEKVASQS